MKLLITEKESREGDDSSVKYTVSNKIDAPASHLIELRAMGWRVETFFRDTKQGLGFGTASCGTPQMPVTTGAC